MAIADMADDSRPSRGRRSAWVWIMIQFFNQQLEVSRSCAAASAHDRDVVLRHKLVHVICKRFRFKRIHGLTIHIQRQSRIWNARNGQRGIFAEEADRLAHVFGSRGAVEPDDVDAHAFEDGERRVDVGAEQHATRRVQRDLSLDRQPGLSLIEGFVNARDGGFDFENVLRGFDQKKIDAALNETDSLLAENIY